MGAGECRHPCGALLDMYLVTCKQAHISPVRFVDDHQRGVGPSDAEYFS